MDAWVNNVTVDSADPEALAAFYAAVLGREVVWRGGAYVVLGRGRAGEAQLVFQRVAEPTPGKSRIHFDLHVTDLAAATTAAVDRGATRHDDIHEHDMHWRVMTDPEGNPFCLSERAE